MTFKDIQFLETKNSFRIFEIFDDSYATAQRVSIPENDKRMGLHTRAILTFYKSSEKIVDALAIYFGEFYKNEQVLAWNVEAMSFELGPYLPALREKLKLLPKAPPVPAQKRGRK